MVLGSLNIPSFSQVRVRFGRSSNYESKLLIPVHRGVVLYRALLRGFFIPGNKPGVRRGLLLYIEALQAKLVPKIFRRLLVLCASDRHDRVIEPLKGDALQLKNFRKAIDRLQGFSPEKSGAFPVKDFDSLGPFF